MIYCPSCQTQVDAHLPVCPHCAFVFSAPGKVGTIHTPPAGRPKIPVLVDCAVTVDRTGSSERFQTGIPLTFEIIVSQLAAKARGVRCWLASHGDLDEGQDVILHTDMGTPDQAIADIKKIPFGGGGDPAEHHLDAILTLFEQVPWQADPTRSRGVVIAFLTADTKPSRTGLSAAEIGRKFRDKDILLYLICEPTPTLVELADAAEGLVFQISNNPDPKELQMIAGKVAASILASVASGGTIPGSVTP